MSSCLPLREFRKDILAAKKHCEGAPGHEGESTGHNLCTKKSFIYPLRRISIPWQFHKRLGGHEMQLQSLQTSESSLLTTHKSNLKQQLDNMQILFILILPINWYETNLKERRDIKGTNKESDEDGVKLSEEKNQLWREVSTNRKHEELTRHGQYSCQKTVLDIFIY